MKQKLSQYVDECWKIASDVQECYVVAYGQYENDTAPVLSEHDTPEEATQACAEQMSDLLANPDKDPKFDDYIGLAVIKRWRVIETAEDVD